MASVLQLSSLTFNGEQVRAVKELLREKVLELPDFKASHTVYSDIVTTKYFGFVGGSGLAGGKDTGCSPVGQDFTISVREKSWTPERWGVRLEQCYNDLMGTVAVYCMQKGIKAADFSDTDYMELVSENLLKAIKAFVWRTIWFGNKNHKTKANGGQLRNGIDPVYFNVIDGFFAQISAGVLANKTRTVEADWSTPAAVRETLLDMYYRAPIELRQQEGLEFLVSQKIYDLYERSLTGVEIAEMYQNMVDGQRVLRLNGVIVKAMPIWDEIAGKYIDEDAAAAYTDMAVLTSSSNLCIGVDDESTLDTLEINYDVRSRMVLVDANGMLDAKVFDERLVVVGIVPEPVEEEVGEDGKPL